MNQMFVITVPESFVSGNSADPTLSVRGQHQLRMACEQIRDFEGIPGKTLLLWQGVGGATAVAHTFLNSLLFDGKRKGAVESFRTIAGMQEHIKLTEISLSRLDTVIICVSGDKYPWTAKSMTFYEGFLSFWNRDQTVFGIEPIPHRSHRGYGNLLHIDYDDRTVRWHKIAKLPEPVGTV